MKRDDFMYVIAFLALALMFTITRWIIINH